MLPVLNFLLLSNPYQILTLLIRHYGAIRMHYIAFIFESYVMVKARV